MFSEAWSIVSERNVRRMYFAMTGSTEIFGTIVSTIKERDTTWYLFTRIMFFFSVRGVTVLVAVIPREHKQKPEGKCQKIVDSP